MPRYAQLSRRWTSVKIILSSRRLSSVRRVSIRARADLYCWVSIWLGKDTAGLARQILLLTAQQAAFPENVLGKHVARPWPMWCCLWVSEFVFFESLELRRSIRAEFLLVYIAISMSSTKVRNDNEALTEFSGFRFRSRGHESSRLCDNLSQSFGVPICFRRR